MNTSTSSSASQFNAPPTSINSDIMAQAQPCDKDGFAQFYVFWIGIASFGRKELPNTAENQTECC